ncbi:Ppx/GppA phosphatase family protein [Cumulibacter manganitolerans]|uniref:Ppx/GppA phosphatase family protein n=1 Tax=Cumulibacter manganitolerans TaxID=1884992 RepID=UPI001295127E|nr:exopolyphosphatase [Cumulibacter manganitolerans]
MPERVAAIDCGTNTLRLLVADVDPSAPVPVRQVVREMRTVRLGEGIERTGEFAPAALERTEATMREYAAIIEAHGVPGPGVVRMVATSASRDVRNRDRLVEIARATVGVRPEVVSGDEEGRLTFAGVLSGLPVDEPTVVVDIGGGSTELITGSRAGVDGAVSTDIGVVRLSERHVHSDPPAGPELARVEADARAAVRAALAELRPVAGRPVVGVAGTATTAAAIAAGLDSYDPASIHGSRVSYPDVVRVLRWSCATDTAGRRAHPAMHPGRASVFPAGMVILDVVLRELAADALVVSESDILDGIALSIGAAR